MFNRKPTFDYQMQCDLLGKAKVNDETKRYKNKTYIDSRKHFCDNQIQTGERASVHQAKVNKLKLIHAEVTNRRRSKRINGYSEI